MILAKDKHGRIGRQVPSTGIQAKVMGSPDADRRGNVQLSQAQIENDHAYWSHKEREANALHRAEAFGVQVRAQAARIKQAKDAEAHAKFQALAKVDPMNEKLKAYYAKRGMMGETAQVADSIRPLPAAPADFSASGGNVQYVDGERMTGGDQWSADWRQHRIMGNPLTRDGVYGPAITDFDRIVRGVDVNQTAPVATSGRDLRAEGAQWGTDVVAGGTMLGRLDGRMAPAGPGQQGMGFDWSWDGITDAISNVADQTVDNVVDKLPDQLAKELQNAVAGGGKVTGSSGGTIVVQRPVTGAVSSVSQTLGVPQWAIYAGVGMIGLGFLLVMVKAVKS